MRALLYQAHQESPAPRTMANDTVEESMSERIPAMTLAATMTLCGLLAVADPVSAQTAGRPAATGSNAAANTGWTGPRTPWGDPDLQGTWTTDETIGVPIQR